MRLNLCSPVWPAAPDTTNTFPSLGLVGVPLLRVPELGDHQRFGLARYYGKHFGCRMVRAGLPVPDSLREFLDGETDMPDAHMVLITTDSIHKRYKSGLSISPDFVEADKSVSRFVRYVLVAYVGSIGVRYEWREEALPERSQFFQYPYPVINRFVDEVAVFDGNTRRAGWFPFFLRWLSRRRA